MAWRGMRPAHELTFTLVSNISDNHSSEIWSGGKKSVATGSHEIGGKTNITSSHDIYATLQNTWLSKDCTRSLTRLLWLWLTFNEDWSRKVFCRQVLDCCGDFLGFRGRVREWYWLWNEKHEITIHFKGAIPLPVTSMTCRRVWTLTHPDSASGHQCPP